MPAGPHDVLGSVDEHRRLKITCNSLSVTVLSSRGTRERPHADLVMQEAIGRGKAKQIPTSTPVPGHRVSPCYQASVVRASHPCSTSSRVDRAASLVRLTLPVSYPPARIPERARSRSSGRRCARSRSPCPHRSRRSSRSRRMRPCRSCGNGRPHVDHLLYVDDDAERRVGADR